jgi:hypothetical protein
LIPLTDKFHFMPEPTNAIDAEQRQLLLFANRSLLR